MRSPVFAWTGNGFAWVILSLFAVTFLAVEITTARWRELIFGDLTKLGDTCTLEVDQGTGFGAPVDQPVPHPGKNLFIPGPKSQRVRLHYSCQVPRFEAGKELTYAHWGWVVGDQVEVKVDGHSWTHYQGADKPVFAARGGERVDFLIETTADKAGSSGLMGNQPAVLARGFRENTLVMGVEILVSILRSLNFLLPLLALGLMISLAWFSGYRVRTLTMAMYLLCCMTAYRLLKASYAFAGSVVFLSSLSVTAHFLYGLSLCLLLMEACRVIPKRIYPIGRVGSVLILLHGAWLAFNPSLINQIYSAQVYLAALALGLTAIAGASFRRLAKAPHRPIGQLAGGVAASISAAVYAVDFFQYLRGTRDPYSLHLDGIVPIVAATFLLVAFSRSEKKFQSEKRTSAALSERVAVEQMKQATLARFLPHSLVARFQDHERVEEQLKHLLEPRRSRVAIIQADLRGFSKLVGDFENAEVLRLLSACFGPVVDQAQKFAMVKVIGDCVFAFVEEQPGEKSPTDYCLDIAHALIASVERVNAELKADQQLRFGIGINYGETFVGNLSSETCIDYTAIGDAVNMTARLEEATKDEAIRSLIGVNGILMSRPAFENLAVYRECCARSLTLANGLRSYPLFKAAYYLTAEACVGTVGQQAPTEPCRPTLVSAA